MSESSDRQDLGTEEPRAAGPVTGEEPPCSTNRTARGDSSPAPPAAGADQDGAQAVEDDFEKLLADAHQERDEYLELARRTKADFENFRKRAAVQAQEALTRGKVEVAREVVDAVDNLERALEAADAGNGEGLAAGVVVEVMQKGYRMDEQLIRPARVVVSA